MLLLETIVLNWFPEAANKSNKCHATLKMPASVSFSTEPRKTCLIQQTLIVRNCKSTILESNAKLLSINTELLAQAQQAFTHIVIFILM